ncbi:hypothetical protein EK21DRAFT_91322 [Setomelanomma holmii]|uniref:Uncharacterized protein n=1 Tax=Setomelanomma holmii TaxID=210430 RepID=A0A9P4H5P4_9PLEO|nr:hypothetical protein EK21DRAFT_91322 [Setomelanomma holmii]
MPAGNDKKKAPPGPSKGKGSARKSASPAVEGKGKKRAAPAQTPSPARSSQSPGAPDWASNQPKPIKKGVNIFQHTPSPPSQSAAAQTHPPAQQHPPPAHQHTYPNQPPDHPIAPTAGQYTNPPDPRVPRATHGAAPLVYGSYAPQPHPSAAHPHAYGAQPQAHGTQHQAHGTQAQAHGAQPHPSAAQPQSYGAHPQRQTGQFQGFAYHDPGHTMPHLNAPAPSHAAYGSNFHSNPP